MKNVKIWLLSLKETFLDAQNTNNMHRDNLNFVSSERGWFSQNGKTGFFPERENLVLLEVTAETDLWYGLIMDGKIYK